MLKTNAILTFTAYKVQDAGITLSFVCGDPGGSEPSDWDVLITDVEFTAALTQQDLLTLVTNKLKRKFRAIGVAGKLDPFIGQRITI